MRAANITTGIVFALWFGLFLMGRGLAYGVYTQAEGVYPSSAQFDFYVVFPLVVAVALTACAWTCNIFRSERLLVVVSLASAGVLLPYLFGYTGGM
jgi:hypothetical protein